MSDPSAEPDLVALSESSSLPRFELPARLERIYGSFGLASEVVYANFVSSLDGAVAFEGVGRASPIISLGSSADRFTVALLRAAADAIVIGAGTYRAHSGPWTAENAFPALAGEFAELRQRLGAQPEPPLIVVTRSGNLGEPKAGAQRTILASASIGSNQGGPDSIGLRDVGSSPRAIVDELRRRGFARVLTEGGPQLMGEFLNANAVDELFLTMSPVVFGETRGRIVGFADGASFDTEGIRAQLSSVRKGASHLFFRYSIDRNE